MPVLPLATEPAESPADLRSVFDEKDRRNRRVGVLIELLKAIDEKPDLSSRLAALEALFAWVKQRDGAVPLPSGEAGAPVEVRRLVVLVAMAEREPALRARFANVLHAVLSETEGLPLFAEAGLPNERGIVDETADRLARRFLPRPRDEHLLARFLGRLFPGRKDVTWLDSLPTPLFARFLAILGDVSTAAPLAVSMGEAMCLMTARIQTLGLSEALRARQSMGSLRDSPFYRLPRSTDALLDALGAGVPLTGALADFAEDAAACREATRGVMAELETTGVSVDVVYSIDVIGRSLDRMEAMIAVLDASSPEARAAAAHRLLTALAKARLSDRSVRDLARENLRLLARKIAERAGSTGEHYITSSRREWMLMLLSAAGGGVLTLGTAALKVKISGAHFAPFVEGLLSSVNYSLSFILILMCGFTLATKQPSMTAAALAGALSSSRGDARIDEVTSLIVRTIRSQLAAATGNVGVVALTALGFDTFWRWRTGLSFLPAEKVDYVLHSFHPFQSGTIFYASLTGIILWLSSIAAGWVENFAVYRRLPQAIAEHRAGRVFGRGTMVATARFFARNVSGYGGSVALGFMLGMTPVFGKFLGLPLDVRHVTLSTGTLALAVAQTDQSILADPRLYWAVLGIAIIFVCNLGVSFLAALVVAMRARNIAGDDRIRILVAVIRRFFKTPGSFFFPPKGEEPDGHGAAQRH
jgi:site-specific recombinase